MASDTHSKNIHKPTMIHRTMGDWQYHQYDNSVTHKIEAVLLQRNRQLSTVLKNVKSKHTVMVGVRKLEH